MSYCPPCMHLPCSSHSPISIRSDFYYCVSFQGLGAVAANIFLLSPLIFYTKYSVLFTLKNTVSSPQLL